MMPLPALMSHQLFQPVSAKEIFLREPKCMAGKREVGYA